MLLSEAETNNEHCDLASGADALRGRRPYACGEIHRRNLGDPGFSRNEHPGLQNKAKKPSCADDSGSRTRP